LAKYVTITQRYPWEMPEFGMTDEGYEMMTADMDPEEEAFMLTMGIDRYLENELKHEYKKNLMRNCNRLYPGIPKEEAETVYRFYADCDADYKKMKQEDVHTLRKLFHKLKALKIEMTTTQEEDETWVRLFGED